MAQRKRHVGAEAIIAERNALLFQYDKAKQQTQDDAVKTDHGNVGEAIVRAWLTQFLPRKYGVAKGYIITSNLAYDGPLEEWDIIIYDRLESPVLFVRKSPDDAEGGRRHAIPIEHVRGVVEVKSTFRPDMARKVSSKLGRLLPFFGEEDAPEYPKFLKPPFVSTAIFFETAVRDYAEYRAALDELTKLASREAACPHGFFILRSQTNAAHGAYLKWMGSDATLAGYSIFPDLSSEFVWPDGKFGLLGNFMGWGVNEFSTYMFDLLRDLNGTRKFGRMSSFYGLDMENAVNSRLFPDQK